MITAMIGPVPYALDDLPSILKLPMTTETRNVLLKAERWRIAVSIHMSIFGYGQPHIVDTLDFLEAEDMSVVVELLLNKFLMLMRLIESRRLINGRCGDFVLAHERRVFSFSATMAGSGTSGCCFDREKYFTGEAWLMLLAENRE